MARASGARAPATLPALLPGRALPDVPIAGLRLDSRRLRAGELFLAVPGASRDGRDFLAQAAAAGAAAIFAEAGLSAGQRRAAAGVPVVEVAGLAAQLSAIAGRYYGQPSEAMYVAGVTGTNGKTTTTRLAGQLLRSAERRCGVLGTLGAALDDSLRESRNTTPDALAVQRQLAEWRDQGAAFAALEVSSHALAQGRVAALRFATAAFTNLSHEHLDYHGDMRRYGLAKAELFGFAGLRTAVVNRDDQFAETVLAHCGPAVEVIGYSLRDSRAELRVESPRHHAGGVSARLRSPWGDGDLHSPLVADFNLSNLLAAIAIACAGGAPLAQVLARAPALRAVPGRMEHIANPLRIQLVVDYSHTPDSLRQALRAQRPHVAGRLICVFGCGGERDAGKRPLMGRVATEHADRVIVTSDNPRGERPASIIEQVLAGCGQRVEVEPDRAAAIDMAVRGARPGDCVLVAGKGHESYQQIGRDRLPFSDARQLRLAARRERAR